MRPGSPPLGFSTLTTSAPSWASTSVQVGPASNCDRSSTLTPARQFGGAAAAAAVIGSLPRWLDVLTIMQPRERRHAPQALRELPLCPLCAVLRGARHRRL